MHAQQEAGKVGGKSWINAQPSETSASNKNMTANERTYGSSNPYYLNFDNKEVYWVGKVTNGTMSGTGFMRVFDSLGGFTDMVGVFMKNSLYYGFAFGQSMNPSGNIDYFYYSVENSSISTEKIKLERNKWIHSRKVAAENYKVIPLSEKFCSKKKYDLLAMQSSSAFSPSHSSSTNTTASSSSSSNIVDNALGIGLVLGGAYSLYKALTGGYDDDDDSSSSEESPSSMQRLSFSNVEIVEYGTYGWLAYSHASVTLRNKNNYDVNVKIQLYQGSWSYGRIVYEQGGGTDRISGVNDEFESTIRVKANSMRKVALRGDGRGRPDYVRIESVY